MSSSKQDPAMLRLATTGGATATVLQHGAQLSSWKSANGLENIYLSELADFSPGSAVRGGAPICFPQFSTLGDLPLHGFARNLVWTMVTDGAGRTDISRLQLADTAETRALWPHSFQADFQAKLTENSLEIALSVINTGSEAFSFTVALHTYFRVTAIENVGISGLQNIRYLDKVEDFTVSTETNERLPVDRPLDRIYYNTLDGLTLEEGDRRLRISSEGMPDTVIWNPGPERCATIADLPDDAWRHFVCIEAGAIEQPISLAPGATWRGVQRMTDI
jgi:glucose-6-phosphate 1-epimerase